MNVHTHATLVAGCYRCELNRDEAPVPASPEGPRHVRAWAGHGVDRGQDAGSYCVACSDVANDYVWPCAAPRSPEGPDEALREQVRAAAEKAGAGALRRYTGTEPGQAMWNWDVEKASGIAAEGIADAVLPLLTAERERGDAAIKAGNEMGRLLGYLLAQYERAVEIHAAVNMDTDEDRALHARAVEQLRVAAEPIRAALSATDPGSTR